ncbi:hypothetical protein OG921_01755 [Aldersonia sp. NBC_00410]|uniref:hypothetical protein n=1 Tax=Aldersonia sp. NBC_00410 TaxID=2975954 RepID=UPI0022565036|nr:hypothetical protein [Aldersonia sp. NBC_00410]MCX5041918.1 hypothetical protein [Aldersonia sp. NBC_00410]
MLIPPATIDAIAEGRVTLAFRRWAQPRVRPGSTIRNARGVVEIVSVEEVDTISAADAKAAGFEDADKLRKLVDKKAHGNTLYRIELRYGGEDPRRALRASADLDNAEVVDLRTRLDRMDKAAEAPWTRRYLHLIAAHPEVVSTELAAAAGIDRPAFKLRVRRLKNLGLTESLDVGYRISQRGRAFLDVDEKPG